MPLLWLLSCMLCPCLCGEHGDLLMLLGCVQVQDQFAAAPTSVSVDLLPEQGLHTTGSSPRAVPAFTSPAASGRSLATLRYGAYHATSPDTSVHPDADVASTSASLKPSSDSGPLYQGAAESTALAATAESQARTDQEIIAAMGITSTEFVMWLPPLAAGETEHCLPLRVCHTACVCNNCPLHCRATQLCEHKYQCIITERSTKRAFANCLMMVHTMQSHMLLV